MAKRFLTLLLVAFATFSTTSSVAQKVVKFSRVEMRSYNEIGVVGIIENDTDTDISVSELRAALKLNGDQFARVAQVGSSVAVAGTNGEVQLILRIESIDPIYAMTLMSMVSQMKFDGLFVDAEALVKVGDKENRIVQNNINLTNIMTIFAPN